MKKDFQKKVLKNGMTILFEKRDVPVVSCIIALRHGSVYELESERGISHFIEHMLYKGTKNRTSKQIGEDIEKNGGEINGFTSEDFTGYWCKIPDNKFNLAFDVLSDLVKNPLFNEKELEKERKVIFEEMNSYKDNPAMYVFEEIQRCLYEGVLAIPVLGTKKTMESINKQKITKRFLQNYTPNNMVLVVVGNSNFNEIIKLAETTFTNAESKIPLQKFNLQNKSEIEKRKGIDQANLVFAYHSPLPKDKKFYATKILISLMADGLSSRLFSEIREKRNLAYAIKGGLKAHKDFCYSMIYVGTMKKNVDTVKKLILKEFEKVSEKLTTKELNSIKNQLIGQYKISMEDSQEQMINLLVSEIITKAEDFYDFEKNVSQVLLKDVKELAKKVSKGDYSFFALIPDN